MRTRRSIPVLLILAALLAVLGLAPVPAGAADSFNFYGSGYGHGLGLSQYGAYGLAKEGWDPRAIVRHFYSKTRVERADKPPDHLRVGLVQGESRIRLNAKAGPVDLRVESPSRGALVGTIPRGKTWSVRPVDGHYQVRNGAGVVVGGHLWGGRTRHLFASYAAAGARVRVPEANHTYNRGYLEFNLYTCDGRCSLRLIAVLAPEAYLFGLAEVPSSWPMPAMEAQAVAGRSYAFYRAASGQHRAVCNCALYASAADQVYAGYDKEGGLDGDRWVRAVKGTQGLVATFRGNVVAAFYSSSSGGYTENNENVWGGSPIAYLRGVCDPGDYTTANPSRTWKVSYSADQVTSRLLPYTGDIGRVTDFTDYDRGVSGRIVTVRVRGTGGSHVISGTQLRAALALRDDRVWINENRNVEGAIRDRYDRLDCAPGLPRSPRASVPGGARQRFQRGAIYRNDVPGVTVWIHGPVYDKYVAVGGVKGVLGLPLTGVVLLRSPDGCKRSTCTRTRFEGGHIYQKERLGPHVVRGAVLSFYLKRNGPDGRLGFPKTDVRRRDDGSTYAVFEGGTVRCKSGGGCSVS